MKSHDTREQSSVQHTAPPQSDVAQKASPPCPYMTIPLEVAQDDKLTDGAVLLFGEVYGLCRAYGQCFASDTHFQSRRSKGRSTIQRQFTELSARGHLYIIKDANGRRELRVAERYLSGKDRAGLPENETPSGRCAKNGTGHLLERPDNENAFVDVRPKNEIYKTPDSDLKNKEKKTTPNLSSGVDFSVKLSPEQQERVWCIVRALSDERNAAGYASLLLQATERGRLDAWDVALASTNVARFKSGHMEKAPIAYFRKVLTESWKLDRDFLEQHRKRDNQATTEMPLLPPTPMKFLAKAIIGGDHPRDDFDSGENEANDWEETRFATPVGDVRSLTAFAVTTGVNATASESAASVYERFIASLPAAQRGEIVAKAKAQVQQCNPAIWLHGETKPGSLRLISAACKELLAKEAGRQN